MKFREHRGGLDDSLSTAVEVADRAAMVEHIARLMEPWQVKVSDELVHVMPYSPDQRIGWNPNSIVILDDYGVVGFVQMAPHFSCPVCGAISYNLNDLEHGWCARCNRQTAARVGRDGRSIPGSLYG